MFLVVTFCLDQLCSFWPQSWDQSPAPVSLPVSDAHYSSISWNNSTATILHLGLGWHGGYRWYEGRTLPEGHHRGDEQPWTLCCICRKDSRIFCSGQSNQKKFLWKDTHQHVLLLDLVTHILFWGLLVVSFSTLILVMSGSRLLIGISPYFLFTNL